MNKDLLIQMIYYYETTTTEFSSYDIDDMFYYYDAMIEQCGSFENWLAEYSSKENFSKWCKERALT